jgi:hypothetical protein
MLDTNSKQQKNNSPENILSEKELGDARNLLKVFLQAWKNYGLFPEGHATSKKSIETLISAFTDFFAKHGELSLNVEKEQLLWEGSAIHEVPQDAPGEDVVYLLYRDGINWIEFLQGLTVEELAYFFSSLNKYKFLQEETEGDIVTALIDGELSHIKFKAADIFWKDYPLLDFSSLNAHTAETGEEGSHIEHEEIELQKSPEHPVELPKSITDPSFSEALWEISTDEQKQLQDMIQQEENWDNSADVFDVLLVILKSQTDQHNFSSALDFTLEEVVETLEQGEFAMLLKLFQSLHQLLYRDSLDDEEPSWTRPLIERFFQDLSKPEIFNLISAKLLTLKDNDTEKIRSLRQVLLYFSPDVILTLDPIITKTHSQEVQKMILEVTEYLCLRDMGPLEKILENPDKKLGEKLLSILSRLKGDRANTIFLKMIKHPSDKVRSQAVRMLVAKNPQSVSKLFSLIDDPSEEVRSEIFTGIALQKSSVVENLLLKHIKENHTSKDPKHILACYESIGHCGSSNSVPFLRRILLSQGWNRFTGFGKLLHREGAATALAVMDTWEAKDILLEASKSKHQIIRQAFQKAMARIDVMRGHTYG